MQVKINNIPWDVSFIDSGDERLVLDETNCLGMTVFGNFQIFVQNDMPKAALRHTLIHELTHAFLFSYGIHIPIDEEDTEEAVCDFVGVYSPRINKLANKILKYYGKGAN